MAHFCYILDMIQEKRQQFLEKLSELDSQYGHPEFFNAIREAFEAIFPANMHLVEAGMSQGTALFEMAMEKEKYFNSAFSQFLNIRNNCSYFLLFDDTSDFSHWKHELYAWCAKLKIPSLKSGDKFKETKDALMVSPYGENFSEVLESESNINKFFEDIYQSEAKLHDFDHDMSSPDNIVAFFDILCHFYNDFLFGWISTVDKHPSFEELSRAIDERIIGRKTELN